MAITTISIEESTKQKLLLLGKMGETWDELLNRLLQERDEKCLTP